MQSFRPLIPAGLSSLAMGLAAVGGGTYAQIQCAGYSPSPVNMAIVALSALGAAVSAYYSHRFPGIAEDPGFGLTGTTDQLIEARRQLDEQIEARRKQLEAELAKIRAPKPPVEEVKA